MIRKKWRDGEPVLSVETEDEFWKAVSTGEAVEVTRELGEKIGLMEEDVGTVAEIDAARYDPEGVRSGRMKQAKFLARSGCGRYRSFPQEELHKVGGRLSLACLGNMGG